MKHTHTNKITALLLALLFSVSFAFPAAAATGTGAASNDLELAMKISSLLGDNISPNTAALMKDIQKGSDATVYDYLTDAFGVPVGVATVSGEKFATAPGPKTMQDAYNTAYIGYDSESFKTIDSAKQDTLYATPLFVSYTPSGDMMLIIGIVNRKSTPVTIAEFSSISVTDNNKKSIFSAKDVALNQPLTISGSDSAWAVAIQAKPGTFRPNADLKNLNNGKVHFSFYSERA